MSGIDLAGSQATCRVCDRPGRQAAAAALAGTRALSGEAPGLCSATEGSRRNRLENSDGKAGRQVGTMTRLR